MAGNAHRSRPRARICGTDCVFCRFSAAERREMGIHNKNGHRRNPARGKRQKKHKVQLGIQQGRK